MKAKSIIRGMVTLAVVGTLGIAWGCSPLAGADEPEATEATPEEAVVEEAAEVEEAAAPEAAGFDWEALIAEHADDPYVATYVDENPETLITFHKMLGKNCVDCHDEETLNEVGTFDSLPDRSQDTIADRVAPPEESPFATREFCLNDGCHNWDNIKDSTILDGDQTIYNPEGKYNVHDNHRGDVDCGQCHSMHGTQTLNCVTCHYMDLPEGWEGFF